jgi:uncharacterized SAM-binding protein YcdF (DUF218 family)
MRRLFETLILPPCSALLLWLCGALLRRRLPRAGLSLQVAGVVWLWLASTPLCAGLLLGTLQHVPALPAKGPVPEAEAIVVLSAELDRDAPEYGNPVIGPMTLQRVRYAADLHRRTGLPVLVSGGIAYASGPSVAELMAKALTQEFAVPVRWREERSSDTWENAAFSAEMLKKDGVKRILLVSTAWHLPRAAGCFRAQGLDVVPAPTAFRGPAFSDAKDLLPQWPALRDTCHALHEWLGRAFYAVRYP